MPAMTNILLTMPTLGLACAVVLVCFYQNGIRFVMRATRTWQHFRLILMSREEHERELQKLLLNETYQQMQNALANCQLQLADSLSREQWLRTFLAKTQLLGCSGGIDLRADSVVQLTGYQCGGTSGMLAKIQVELELQLQMQRTIKLREQIIAIEEQLRKTSIQKQLLQARHHFQATMQRIERLLEHPHLKVDKDTAENCPGLVPQYEAEACQLLNRLIKAFSADAMQYLELKELQELQKFVAAAALQMNDSVYGVTSAQSDLVKQIEHNREKIQKWQSQASSAMRRDRWENVRSALEQIQLHTAAVESLLPQVECIAAHNSKLIARLAQFQRMQRIIQARIAELKSIS